MMIMISRIMQMIKLMETKREEQSMMKLFKRIWDKVRMRINLMMIGLSSLLLLIYLKPNPPKSSRLVKYSAKSFLAVVYLGSKLRKLKIKLNKLRSQKKRKSLNLHYSPDLLLSSIKINLSNLQEQQLEYSQKLLIKLMIRTNLASLEQG